MIKTSQKTYSIGAHHIYVAGCTCRGCSAKREDYAAQRRKAIQVAESLPVATLTLEQAAALLPIHPEWK